MTSAILELDAPQVTRGIRSQHLWLAGHEGRRVPGLIVSPEDASTQKTLVALGHGAGGSKDEEQMQRIARWLVRRNQCAVVIIDGPAHGERAPSGVNGGIEFIRDQMGRRETYEAMAGDWRRALDACQELDGLDTSRIAYLGFSMGTMFGVPTVASEPRFACAVFAIGGIAAPMQQTYHVEAARRIQRPVLMINQTEDEIFSREAAFNLYDALPGPKRLFFYPGAHSAVPREAMERVGAFLQAHLTGELDESGAPTGAW